MRILYQAGVDLSLPQGNAVHVRRLAQCLESNGQTVHLLTPHPSADIEWPGPEGGWTQVRGIALPRLRHLTRELRLAHRAQAEARMFQPDIRLIRQELFCFSPLLLPRSCTRTSPRATRCSRERGVAPLVLEIHASHGELTAGKAGGTRTTGGLRAKAARAVEGASLRRADAIAAVTEPLASSLIELHRLDPRRVHVIPNGAWIPPLLGRGAQDDAESSAVDDHGPRLRESRDAGDELLRIREAPGLGDQLLDIRRTYGAGDSDFVIAFAGNLNHVQDLGSVLEAASLLRDLPLRLWIAGAGTERATLEGDASRLGLADRVSFFGGLPEEDAARLVQAAQATIVPYHAGQYEALGGDSEALKLLQGLACDRPLLVTKARGLDLVERLGAGEQVASGDPAAWAAALAGWAKRWIDSGRPLSDWPWPEGEGPGRRYVASARTWDHCAAAWISLFERVIASMR